MTNFRSVACPRCGARPGERCVTSRGDVFGGSHASRAEAARRRTIQRKVRNP